MKEVGKGQAVAIARWSHFLCANQGQKEETWSLLPTSECALPSRQCAGFPVKSRLVRGNWVME